jgi:hypothetical protein
MNEEHPHAHEEGSFTEVCWEMLLNSILFLLIALVLSWFSHLIWDSLNTGITLTWMNWFGLMVLARFVGFAFNYDVGGNY